ncbi:MAG: DUF2695 domain-containing protein [Myxococcota bacterium]
MRFDELPLESRNAFHALKKRMGMRLHAECVDELRNMVRKHPGYVYGYTMLADCLERTGRWGEVEDLYRRAVQLDPHNPFATRGLAWTAVRQTLWDAARGYAQRLLESSRFRGDALAVLAHVKQAEGDPDGAAADFLEAYRFDPKHTWLKKHCELVGRPFRIEGANSMVDWDLSVPERLWLYAFIDNALTAIANTLPDPGDNPLAAACDHTPKFATEWAEARGLDLVQFYEQLFCRGGYSDSEILMNAARLDDRDYGTVLFAAELSMTDQAELEDVWGGWLELTDHVPPPRPEDLDSAPGPRGLSQDTRLLLPPQATWSRFVGCLLEWAVDDRKSLRMILLSPEGVDSGYEVTVADGALTCRSLEPGPTETVIDEVYPDSVEVLRRAVLVPGPETLGESLEVPTAAGPLGALLCRAGSGWSVVDGTSDTPIALDARQLAVDPERHRIAWLEPFRNQHQLIVEDLRAGIRRRVRTDRFFFLTGYRSLEFDRRGLLYASIDCGGVATLFSFDPANGKMEKLGPGTTVRASSDRLAVVAKADEPIAGDPNVIHVVKDGSVDGSYRGSDPHWSPDGRTLVFTYDTGEHGRQLFAARDGGKAQRISPVCEEVAWTSFGAGGFVFYARTARRRTPRADGEVMVRDDERLLYWPLDGSPRQVLYASDDGWMRIVSPLAHPTEPVVVFRTQDEPQVNVRLVSVSRNGEVTELADGGLSPYVWLPTSK